MTGKAVVGPLTGAQLKWMPSEVTTWRQWRKKHEKTTALKPPFGPERYARVNLAYDVYWGRDELMFPPGPHKISDKYEKKSHVTIVMRDGKARCYPHAELKEGVNQDGDFKIVKEGISVRVLGKDGQLVPSQLAFWFAWCAYHPDGTVYARKKD